jgi:hypothetical protein
VIVVMGWKTFVALRTGHRDDFARSALAPAGATYRRTPSPMPHLEEITYDLGRAALADQESLVSGIRSRTGTLIATQALVASFLGGAAIEGGAPGVCGWSAIAMLVVGLGLSVVVLAPWRMRFALDSRSLYGKLKHDAASEDLVWLAVAGFAHEEIRMGNRRTVRVITLLSILISIATVLQLLLWIVTLAVA